MTETWRTLLGVRGDVANDLSQVGWTTLGLLLVVSAVAAALVGFAYRRTFLRRASGSDIDRAFVLLGVAVTAIFITIQFSLPLSLGLLGALSIVRFRTPIKEPEEIAYLMMVVATSLACATANVRFLGVLLAVAFLALAIQTLWARRASGRGRAGLLVVACDVAGYDAASAQLFALVAGRLRAQQLESLMRQDGEMVATWSFEAATAGELPTLERELAALPAVRRSSVLLGGPPTA